MCLFIPNLKLSIKSNQLEMARLLLASIVVLLMMNKQVAAIGDTDSQPKVRVSSKEQRCIDMDGFYYLGSCYHFEGVTNRGVVVKNCPGQCTLWSICVENYPEETC